MIKFCCFVAFVYLEEAGRMNASSVDQAAAAIAQFETSTGHRDFGAFHFEHARKFKRVLAEATNPATGNPLAKATIHSRLMAVKAFFIWLAGQPGYRSRLTYSDMDYFNPSNNDSRIAKTDTPTDSPRSRSYAYAVGSGEARPGIGRLRHLERCAR
jgi:hypothetical protein